ncbi:hypothetical protein [Pandoraea pnomenusa]|nr:hypothetical protein [Pandoraea pnomenusa]
MESLAIFVRRLCAASFVFLKAIVSIANRNWEHAMNVADRNEFVVRRLIAQHLQKTVADAINVERSNFSRFHNNRGHGLQLGKFCELLAFLGLDLSLIPEDCEGVAAQGDTITIPRAQYEAMRVMLKHSLGD